MYAETNPLNEAAKTTEKRPAPLKPWESYRLSFFSSTINILHTLSRKIIRNMSCITFHSTKAANQCNTLHSKHVTEHNPINPKTKKTVRTTAANHKGSSAPRSSCRMGPDSTPLRATFSLPKLRIISIQKPLCYLTYHSCSSTDEDIKTGRGKTFTASENILVHPPER